MATLRYGVIQEIFKTVVRSRKQKSESKAVVSADIFEVEQDASAPEFEEFA